jgi:hypothetical protein
MVASVRALKLSFLLLLILTGPTAHAASYKIIKVLPQFLDQEGHHAASPSLFERDAYQEHLRRHPELRSGIRFAILWKSRGSAQLKLRVEMRGARGMEPTTAVLEEPVKKGGILGNWSFLKLTGEKYKTFGELAAWHATLWEGDRQVAEQRSFLW